MKSHPRYEIIAPLAKGDYATIYRAKDKELGREVAVKQIHQQYLEDPQQLDRYWQEAQLLAKLEHPRIMTIYDIVRTRGWLVLELMQGSLLQIQNGAPIDLNVMRMALVSGLHALHFLQQNGIIHGDVKPSNLLVDKNNRVKLGDFGIARRMTGDPGSIIKGTTKYMAPEVLTDQFGDVGPHSDLYSLGFSCYELMCGSHFDTLFPGLDMFGRDRQIAWMMWHSSLDRRLPEIQRVLQGVPDDLTYVIQKLVEKDPAKRYKTAEEVVSDLQSLGKGGPPAASQDEKEATLEVAKQARRKRMLLFGALGVSVALSVAMFFIPPSSKPPPTANPTGSLDSGVLQDVNPESKLLFVLPESGGESRAIRFNPELDTLRLNDRRVELSELAKGDQIQIKYLKSQDDKPTKEILASRAEARPDTGTIAAVDLGTSMVTLTTPDKGQAIEIHVPTSATLLFNEGPNFGNRPVELGDLKVGDQVVVRHMPAGGGRAAVTFHVTRKVSVTGTLVSADATAGKVVVKMGDEPKSPRKTLAVDKDCELSLNGAASIDGKPLTLADLQADDKVQIEHDARVTRLVAFRSLTVEGEVEGTPDATSISLQIAGHDSPVRFTMAADCKLELASGKSTIDWRYLRRGDKATITHASVDLKNPQATSIVVERLFDQGKWAVVIAQQHYDDKRLSEIEYAAADGKLLREALATRYRVPAEQIFYAEDSSRLRLEPELEAFLKKVTPGSQLVVYYLGHAFLIPAGPAVLAPKEFDSTKPAATGWELPSLMAQLEPCAATEKILLVDACHNATGGQPSSAEIVESLRRPGSEKVSTSVNIFVSCSKGEIGKVESAGGVPHSAFALTTVSAFRGAADTNHDLRVDVDELEAYLNKKMGELGGGGIKPAIPRYKPDSKPERLTQGAKDAVRKLLGHLSATRVDPKVLTDDWLAARELAPKQPEPPLAYGLVLLKLSKGADAMIQFEAVKAEHPDLPLVHHALAWQHFSQGNLTVGVTDLVQLVGSLPRPKEGAAWSPYAVHCLGFAGSLRQFAYKAAEKPLGIAAFTDLDEQIKSLDEAGKAHYVKALSGVNAALEKLDEKIATAEGPDKRLQELKRRSPATYVTFDFPGAARYVRAMLDK